MNILIQIEKDFHEYYDLVLMNWTLHFIKDKEDYLESIFHRCETLIMTDKLVQSDKTKELYYNFKRKNGISEEYIKNNIQNEFTCEFIIESDHDIFWSIDKKKTINKCLNIEYQTQRCRISIEKNEEKEISRLPITISWTKWSCRI